MYRFSTTLILLLAITISQAANITWTNGNATGLWNDPLNWSTSSIPGSGDVAIFDGTSTANCAINAAVNVQGFTISAGYVGTITQNSGIAMTIGTNGLTQNAGTFLGGNTSIDCNGRFTLGGGSFQSTSAVLYVGGNWTSDRTIFNHTAGTFSHNSGTVEFDVSNSSWGGRTYTIDVIGSTSFYDVIIDVDDNGNGGDETISTGASDVIQIENSLDHDDGIVRGDWEVEGDLIVGSGANQGSGWIILTGSSSANYTYSGSGRTCGIEISKSSATVSQNTGTTELSCARLLITSGTFTAPSSTLFIGGNWSSNTTIFEQTGGTLAHNNGTVEFDPSFSSWGARTYTVDPGGSTTFNDLILDGTKSGGGGDVTITVATGETVNAIGDITHDDGYINGDWTLDGDFYMNPSAIGGSGWIEFDGTSGQQYHMSGAGRTCGLIVNKSSGSVTPGTGTTDLSCSRMLIQNGGFTAPSGLLRIGGTWTSSITLFEHTGGSFTHNSGTVEFDPTFSSWGARTYTIDPFSSTGFNHIIIDGTKNGGGGDVTLVISSGESIHAAGDITHDDGYINGTWQLDGDFYMNSEAAGGTGWIEFVSTTAQEYDVSGATARTCGISIDKTSGDVSAASGTNQLHCTKFRLINGIFEAPSTLMRIGGVWSSSSTLFEQTGGTFTHNSGSVEFDPIYSSWGAATFDVDVLSSTAFNHLIIDGTKNGGGGDVTLVGATGDDIFAEGDITHDDGYMNGLWQLEGDFYMNSNAGGGTGWIEFVGTAAQEYDVSSTSARTCGLSVDKTSNSVSPASGTNNLQCTRLRIISGGFVAPTGLTRIGGPWTSNTTLFEQTGGTFAHNSGTVELDPAFSNWGSRTFYVDPIASTYFNNLIVDGSKSGGGGEVTLQGTGSEVIHALSDLTHDDGLMNGTWRLEGDFHMNAGAAGGSGWIEFVGGASQEYDVSSATARTAGISIDKSGNGVTPATGTTDLNCTRLQMIAGDFTAPAGLMRIGGTWNQNVTLIDQSGGSFMHNSGSVELDPTSTNWAARTYSVDFLATNALHNLILDASDNGNGGEETISNIGATVNVDNDVTHDDGLVRGDWSLSGDLYLNAGAAGGTGWFVFAGSTDQDYIVNGGSPRTCGIRVNKGSGDVYPDAGTVDFSCQQMDIRAGGIYAPIGLLRVGGTFSNNTTLFEHSAGTFYHNNGAVEFDPSFTGWGVRTFTISTLPLTIFNDVTLDASGESGGSERISISAGDTLNVNGLLVLDDGQANTGAIRAYDDVTVNAGFDGGSAELIFAGSNLQDFDLTGATNRFNGDITLNKDSRSATVTLISNLDMDQSGTFLNLIRGKLISTPTERLTLRDGVDARFENNHSFVEGPIRKIGNDAFDFPVGRDTIYAMISISAPSSSAASFEAWYLNYPTPDSLAPLDAGLNNISEREYWILNRLATSNSVYVTLSWDYYRSGTVRELDDLRVCRFDNTMWDDHGNGATSGDDVSGTVQSSAPVSQFSPFTLGSSSGHNPLPIELVSFEAELNSNGIVDLEWVTSLEIDNDFFTIERSKDLNVIEEVVYVDGAGNSTEMLSYHTVDLNPLEGVSYYRLKQTDFDGTFDHSDWVMIVNNPSTITTQILPNPNNGAHWQTYYEGFGKDEVVQITIWDMSGQMVYSASEMTNSSGTLSLQIQPDQALASGQYLMIAESAYELITEEFQVY